MLEINYPCMLSSRVIVWKIVVRLKPLIMRIACRYLWTRLLKIKIYKPFQPLVHMIYGKENFRAVCGRVHVRTIVFHLC
jgi:hypothetical protein